MTRGPVNRVVIASQEGTSEYEKLRLLRIAENKARMAALGIVDHVRTMTEFFKSAKRAPRRTKCKPEFVEVRRSNRIKGVGTVEGCESTSLEQCEENLRSLQECTHRERLVKKRHTPVVKTIKKRHGRNTGRQSGGCCGVKKEALSGANCTAQLQGQGEDLFVELEPVEGKLGGGSSVGGDAVGLLTPVGWMPAVVRPGNQPMPSKVPQNLSLSPFLREHRCDSKGRGSIYDSIVGICCHFCRQKKLCGESDCERCGFMDVNKPCKGKSDCSRCHSSTGVFCRACLKVRYGQEMEDVYDNPEWLCPHCMMEDGTDPFWLCNSSICLKKWGFPPTGIAIHTAKQQGYESVAHYLKAQLEREGRRPQL